MVEFKSINNLANKFSKLSGVGKKTAQRYAYDIVEKPKDWVDEFIENIIEVKNNIKFCKICCGFSEEEICPICRNKDNKIICVVAYPKDVFIMQKVFRGAFHVLHGVISPMEGRSAENLTIKKLLQRLDGVQEIILAIGTNVEGEATALYLAQILKPLNIRVTRLAQGISMGSDIEYADEVTLNKAITSRVEI